MTKPTRILLVDDNAEMLEVLTLSLQTHGYQVFEARTGQEGIELAREKQPDLVLLDVVLPDIHGLEVCRRIKSEPLCGNTFVVLISGHATTPQDTIRGLHCGADEYISRPIQMWELLARIATMVRIQQSQEALREAEERWHSLLENAPDCILTLDPAWRIQFINRPFPGISADEMVGAPLLTYVPREYQGRVSAALREADQTGRTVSYETPFSSGASERWFWHHVGPLRREGPPPLLVLIATDVTDRKRAEQNIQQYADIVANMQVGLVVWHLANPEDLRSFTIMASNPASTRFTGVPAEEILGKTMAQSFPRLLETPIPARFAEVIETGHPVELGEIHYTDERVAFGVYQARAFPMPNRCVGVLFENITDRYRAEIEIKKLNQTLEARVAERTAQLERANQALRLEVISHESAEEALRESEKKFRTVFEAAPDVLYTVAADGTFSSLNPAFEVVTGWPCEEWLGRPFRELLHPEHRAFGVERFRKIMAGEKPRPAEYRVRRKSGAYFYAEVVTTPQIESNQIIGLIGFGRDITQRKRVERRLNMEYAVTRILVESETAEEAYRRILQAVGENLGWDQGELWSRDEKSDKLIRAEIWPPGGRASTGGARSRRAEKSGAELARRTWDHGKPIGVSNLLEEMGLPQAGGARRDGARGAVAFPIRTAGGVAAVMTFFSREIAEDDPDMLKVFSAIGSQIGLFIDRKHAEEALRESDRRFVSFMNHTSAVAWMKDEQYRYLYMNPAGARLAGKSADEILGKEDSAVWGPAIAREFRLNDEMVHRTGKTLETYETIQTTDAKVEYYWVFKFPIDTGKRRLLGGIAVDITERLEAEDALRGLPKRIFEAEEAERRRVARELHDSVNQILTSVQFRIQSLEEKLPAPPLPWRSDLVKAKALLADAVREVRRISHNLRPSELDDLGLIPAVRRTLQDFEERTGIAASFKSPRRPPRLPPDVALALYRIIQEALNNVEKHSGARKVFVTFQVTPSLVKLAIRDDGSGFPSARMKTKTNRKSGFGLVNMRERASFIGGTLVVEPVPGKGTEIRLTLPHPSKKPD